MKYDILFFVMEMKMIAFFLIASGILNLRSIRKFLSDQHYAEDYIKTRHKAALLRRFMGPEKALEFTRHVLVPLGLALSGVFIVFGILILLTPS